MLRAQQSGMHGLILAGKRRVQSALRPFPGSAAAAAALAVIFAQLQQPRTPDLCCTPIA